MKQALLAMVGLGLLLGCVAVAKAANADILTGKVVSVDTAAGTMVVKPKTGDNVTVATDADTKVKVDGKEAKLADVKAGMFVYVKPVTGTAKMITAITPKPQ